MAERPEFQRKQFEFAAHIRDPKNVPAPEGVEDRRMAIYRQLFFNNLRNLLGNMFPVLKKLHEPARWNHLVRQFMRSHRASTPYFLQLPREFLAFLQETYEPDADDFPFLVELAHYEYIELALSIAEAEIDLAGIDPRGDLLTGVPVKSELAWIYAYSYPVHRISPDFKPAEPLQQPAWLAVYRQSDDRVGFLELNPVTARLLSMLEANDSGLTGETLLRRLAEVIAYPDADALVRHGREALEEMRDLEIVLGTRN